ncbi:nucleotidyltransferase domain-containing protein [Candidatus Uhrbacteria bacterium]|nr:nucleotidyltransferase domain-containing protein [Candidatus Uhrbacteria bacterium]
MNESLQERHQDMICKIVKQIIPNADVFLFGSRANGTAIPSSDADLAIRADAPLDFKTRAQLTEAFSESDLPFSVDVVDMRSVDPEFLTVIEKHAVMLC